MTKTIVIVAVLSMIIYKTGAARWFLEKLRKGTPAPWPAEIRKEQKTPLIIDTAADRLKAQKMERAQLEIDAAYIVKMQGCNPATVKYMSDDLLRGLINDFIKECNKE